MQELENTQLEPLNSHNTETIDERRREGWNPTGLRTETKFYENFVKFIENSAILQVVRVVSFRVPT